MHTTLLFAGVSFSIKPKDPESGQVVPKKRRALLADSDEEEEDEEEEKSGSGSSTGSVNKIALPGFTTGSKLIINCFIKTYSSYTYIH